MTRDVDYNQFRRYIGDFNFQRVDDEEIETYLDDATVQATAVHVSPDVPEVTLFDSLYEKYKPEVILLAAINWWWNKAAEYADKLSTSIGDAAQQASERWQHAMQMIESLMGLYDETKVFGQDPDMGNLSIWNRNSLTRTGGKSEEDAKASFIPDVP